MQPLTDTKWGVAHGVRPADMAAALQRAAAAGQPVKAVLVVSPTYYGYVSDIEGAHDCFRRSSLGYKDCAAMT